jgi:ABC-type lipoprotein export system ATPase subunit
MRLTITYPLRPRRRTVHTSLVADHFGLGDEPSLHVVARELELPIEAGSVVAFTGPSGSGKSSLLNAVVADLEQSGQLVLRCDSLELPDVATIDALGVGFEQATALLSTCGLADPRLMLRRPAELSDGERWRFRMALALAKGPQWIAVDEFTAALDRTLARVVAYNLRRQCDRTSVGVLVATCHDDVLADLSPDVHVKCDHDGAIDVRVKVTNVEPADGSGPPLPRERGTDRDGRLRTHRTGNTFRASPRLLTPSQTPDHHSPDHHSPRDLPPCSAWQTNSKSRPERRATGRISLGGITGRTASAESGS